MGTRWIRQASDTPNVSNTDDARMIRYAYGYQDGILKNVGAQVAASASGNTFKLESGVIVLHGWELAIDASGWSMTVDNVATKRYYAVYYEINLATGIAEIKSVYSTSATPSVLPGVDLSAETTGTARLLLYTFSATSGIISSIVRTAELVEPWTAVGFAKKSDLTSGAYSVGKAEWASQAEHASTAGSASSASEAETAYKAELAKRISTDIKYVCKIQNGEGSVGIIAGTYLYRLRIDKVCYFGIVVFGRNYADWAEDITRQALPLTNIYCSFEPYAIESVKVFIRESNSTVASGYSGTVSFVRIAEKDFFYGE